MKVLDWREGLNNPSRPQVMIFDNEITGRWEIHVITPDDGKSPIKVFVDNAVVYETPPPKPELKTVRVHMVILDRDNGQKIWHWSRDKDRIAYSMVSTINYLGNEHTVTYQYVDVEVEHDFDKFVVDELVKLGFTF